MTTYHHYPPQDSREFERFCQMVRAMKPNSYLEVGSRHGRSLIRVAEAGMPSIKRIVVIDMPEGRWGETNSEPSLEACCQDLRDRGIHVDLHKINSQGEAALEVAESLLATVDLVFIDADHAYESARKDFNTFSRCVSPGGMLAMHDIKGKTWLKSRGVRMGVPHFWCHLKDSGKYHLEEIETPGKYRGIGIVKPLAPETILRPLA